MDNIVKIYYSVNELAELCSITPWKLRQICKDYGIKTRRLKNGAKAGASGAQIFDKEQAEYILEVSRWEKKTRAELITAIIHGKPNILSVA